MRKSSFMGSNGHSPDADLQLANAQKPVSPPQSGWGSCPGMLCLSTSLIAIITDEDPI